MNNNVTQESSLTGKAVNFHITEKCNMSCKFCFAKYCAEKELGKLQAFEIVEQLAQSGVAKINFAGGEPFLLPHLGSLVLFAKQLGMTTGVITNGSGLSTHWLDTFGLSLDWLGVSIDSISMRSNYESGRYQKNGIVQNFEQLESYLLHAQTLNVSTKINTVVSRYNLNDDLTSLIETVKPDRWKIFQALPIEGANNFNDFTITLAEYNGFLKRHQKAINLVNSIPENNDLMTSSYIMISPQGRFYSNSTGCHVYSEPILKIGIANAFRQVEYNHNIFHQRRGITK